MREKERGGKQKTERENERGGGGENKKERESKRQRESGKSGKEIA